MLLRHRNILILSVLVAGACNMHYPLMAFYRKAFMTKFPELTQGWNKGSFAVIGWGYPFLDEGMFAARTQTAARHWLPYDPYIKENRRPRLICCDFLNFFILGLVQRAVGNIQWTWSLCRLVLAFFWFYLAYLLAERTTRAPPVALFFSVFITFFGYLLYGNTTDVLRGIDLATLQGALRACWDVLRWGRAEHVVRLTRPAITFPAIFAVSLLTIKALEQRGPALLLAAGAASGLLAYVHVDVWTTQIGSCALLVFFECFRSRRIAHALWLLLLPALALSLPWAVYCLPLSPELAAFTHAARRLDWISLLYLAAFLEGLRRCAKKASAPLLYLTVFEGSLFIICSLQFITGSNGVINHWHFFGNIYTFLFVLNCWESAKNKVRPWNVLSLATAGAFVIQSMAYAATRYPLYAYPKPTEEAMEWLDRNSPPDSVVATLDPAATFLLPMLTHCKVLTAYDDPFASDLPRAENAARFRLALRLFGVPLEQAARENQRLGFLGKFAASSDVAAEAASSGIGLDYFWLGPLEKKLLGGKRAAFADARPVFANEEVAIFRASPGMILLAHPPAKGAP
jgi:hypothetical protein